MTFLLPEGDNNKKSYEKLFTTLDGFERISGLKLNYDKQKKHWNCIFVSFENDLEPPQKFKILGLWFTNDLTRMTEPTVANTFNEIVKVFNMSERIKSPLRRVAILRSLVIVTKFPQMYLQRGYRWCVWSLSCTKEKGRERARNNCS